LFYKFLEYFYNERNFVTTNTEAAQLCEFLTAVC